MMDTNRKASHKGTDADRHDGGDGIAGPPVTQHGTRVLGAALVAALSTPATTEEIGARVGLAPKWVLPHLVQLVREGELIRRGPHWLAAGCGGSASGETMRLPSRPQPIRDMILAFLSEPRQAKEVSRHIGRSVPNATGHLAAMARRGLVVRIGYGRYERADLAADGAHPAVIVRPHPVRDVVVAGLGRPMHYSIVAASMGRTPACVKQALHQLARDGVVVYLGGGAFAPVRNTAKAGARAGGSVFATSGDAEASNGKEDPCNA